MNQIDPNTFLRPATVKASEVKGGDKYFIDCAGWRLPVRVTTKAPSGKIEIEVGNRQSYGTVAPTVTMVAVPDELLDVFEYDELAHKREVTAAKLAKADGVTDWHELHEEDRARWLRLVEAISYGQTSVPAPSGRPVQDPAPAAVTGKAGRR